jgi:predicted RNA-binding protein with PIN domain
VARWLVDGNNVMGSRPDGWWRDREGAMQRLVGELDAFAERTGDEVAVVFDGSDRGLQADHVEIGFAPDADDAIADRAADGMTVVTSDGELRRRVSARERRPRAPGPSCAAWGATKGSDPFVAPRLSTGV